jgi:hypothetical protein
MDGFNAYEYATATAPATAAKELGYTLRCFVKAPIFPSFIHFPPALDCAAALFV